MQDLLEKEFANITKLHQDEFNSRLKQKIGTHLRDLGLDIGQRNLDSLMQSLDERLRKSENFIIDQSNKTFGQKYKKFIKEIDRFVNLKLKILANKSLPENVYQNISEYVLTEKKSPILEEISFRIERPGEFKPIKSQSPIYQDNFLGFTLDTPQAMNVTLNSTLDKVPVKMSSQRHNQTLDESYLRSKEPKSSAKKSLHLSYQTLSSPSTLDNSFLKSSKLWKEKRFKRSASFKLLTQDIFGKNDSHVGTSRLINMSSYSLSPQTRSNRMYLESPSYQNSSKIKLQEKDVTKFLVKQTDRIINSVNEKTNNILEKLVENKCYGIQIALQREIHSVFSKNIVNLKEIIEEKITQHFDEFLRLHNEKESQKYKPHIIKNINSLTMTEVSPKKSIDRSPKKKIIDQSKENKNNFVLYQKPNKNNESSKNTVNSRSPGLRPQIISKIPANYLHNRKENSARNGSFNRQIFEQKNKREIYHNNLVQNLSQDSQVNDPYSLIPEGSFGYMPPPFELSLNNTSEQFNLRRNEMKLGQATTQNFYDEKIQDLKVLSARLREENTSPFRIETKLVSQNRLGIKQKKNEVIKDEKNEVMR